MAHSPLDIFDEAHLRQILEGAGIDLSSWGKNGKSTVLDLFDETAKKKECVLVMEEGRLYRFARVVKMHIFEPSRGLLKEVRLIKADDTIRRREIRPPGGKVGANETLEEALIRETREELRLFYEFGDYTYRFAKTVPKEESSSSYPGLPSRYEVTVFDLTLSEQSLQRVAPEGHACLDPETGTIIHCAWFKE